VKREDDGNDDDNANITNKILIFFLIYVSIPSSKFYCRNFIVIYNLY